MTLAATPRGLIFPTIDLPLAAATNATLDAATEKYAAIGRLYVAGRSTSAKTLSTGTIQYRTGAVTFANGSTTVDIGIQDVASGAGPIAQPDGTFDVKTTLTGGGGGITGNAWNTATMNSGSKSMTHGDLIAVVWDMTARAGADSVIITGARPLTVIGGIAGSNVSGFPTTNAFVSSAWQTTTAIGAAQGPNVIIIFDDGTVGWIDFSTPYSSLTQDQWADGTNPDERGMIFQVPWDCKIDAIWAYGGTIDAASDFSLKLYSDPTGTPSAIVNMALLAEQFGTAASNLFMCYLLATEVALSKNTDYAVTMRASGASNMRLQNITLGNTAHRVTIPGGATLAKATRDNDTGAFTAENPAVTIYNIGVRISQFHDTGGSQGVIGG